MSQYNTLKPKSKCQDLTILKPKLKCHNFETEIKMSQLNTFKIKNAINKYCIEMEILQV